MSSLLFALLVATDSSNKCAHDPRVPTTLEECFWDELLANAELAEHAVQHFLCDIIATDLPQRCYCRPQINGPEVDRKAFADAVCDC
jgi:hypothetical protein